MCVFIWLMVSVIILTITIWVHRHTYGAVWVHGKYVADLHDPAPSPMWLFLSVVVGSFIPIVNVAAFISGMILWLINYSEDNIRLGNLPKWSKSVQEFLTK